MSNANSPDTSIKHDSSELAMSLRMAREALGLELSQVAEEMNIRPEKLAIFETEEMDIKALDHFERGYLRNYAAKLELDLAVYEYMFPDGATVSYNLTGVADDSSTSSPLMSHSWVVKLIFLVGLVTFITLLVVASI